MPEDDGDGGDNGDDEVTGAPLVQETRLTPVVTTGDSTGESKGFETVDEGEEAPINKVVISIPAKDIAKPEGSGQAGKDLLFEFEEDTDPEVQRQIEATRDSVSVMQELHLLEEDDDDPGDSDDHGEGGELDETKQYDPDQGGEEAEASESKPDNPTADPPTVPDRSGNPDGSNLDNPSGDVLPAKPATSKGKGPNHEGSGKAPAPKVQLSAAALGVQDLARSTLFDVATLAQAIGLEEDTVRRLENYTGVLARLQKLVGIMASGYEAATEDIRSLVASTLNQATLRDHNFVAESSQALADWTAKYQQAMSQGGSLQEQLASWDQVREAGIALSRKITALTSEEGSTASGEIFKTLLPACFQHIRIRTKATFAELNANLPSLLCRFVTPDQAGHILASIFTCLCNYNTKICGMAMAQTVVPVYTIPNTYRVQQSLWESMCRIIPGIA